MEWGDRESGLGRGGVERRTYVDPNLGSCWDGNVADGVGMGCDTHEEGSNWGIEAEGLVQHGIEVGEAGVDCDEVDFGFGFEERADLGDRFSKSARIGKEVVCGARQEGGGGFGTGEDKNGGIAVDFFIVDDIVFGEGVDEVVATILGFVVQATIDGGAGVVKHVVSNGVDGFWHDPFDELAQERIMEDELDVWGILDDFDSVQNPVVIFV